jgi:hypothetical protein
LVARERLVVADGSQDGTLAPWSFTWTFASTMLGCAKISPLRTDGAGADHLPVGRAREIGPAGTYIRLRVAGLAGLVCDPGAERDDGGGRANGMGVATERQLAVPNVDPIVRDDPA